jgi:hypothetical protein
MPERVSHQQLAADIAAAVRCGHTGRISYLLRLFSIGAGIEDLRTLCVAVAAAERVPEQGTPADAPGHRTPDPR